MKKATALFIAFIFSAAALYADNGASFFGNDEEQLPQTDPGSVLAEDDGHAVETGINDYSQSYALIKGDGTTAAAGMEAVDVLKGLPGITLNKSGLLSFGMGVYAPSTLRIRGMGATPNSGILLVVDGRPQYSGIYRHPLFDSVMLDAIDSIEVTKGPAGTLYGNMASAGVISIKTKKIENDGMEIGLNTALGTHYTQDYSAGMVFKQEEIDFSIYAGYSSAGGERTNSDSYIESLYGHAGYRMDDTLYAAFNGTYGYTRAFNPGPEGVYWPRDAEGVVSFERNADFRIEYDGGDHKATYMVYSDVGSNRFLLSAVKTGPSAYTFQQGGLNEHEDYGAKADNEWILLPGNSTKAGFDWNYFSGYFENYPSDTSLKLIEKERENEYAPYVIVSQTAGIFGISAGYRYAFNSVWGWEGIPQAGFKISFFDGQYIYLNASKGYKTPAMGQLLYAGYEDLKPESFWQYELGTTHTIFEKVDYKISLYQTEGQNIIKVTGMAPAREASNSGFILIRGIEASVDTRPYDWLEAGLSASYNDPREKTAGNAYTTAGIYAKAKLFGVTCSLTGNYEKDRYDGDNKTIKLDDCFIMDMGLSYKAKIFGEEASFFVDITNLLNEKYYVRDGYPADGFNVRAGVGVKI
ncbi:MAG: TonB-dependent receptor plug domain-containing protein [Spirochaetia bacterium]|nr:TonB-dependent receptor plug domain-containing protein [Spirochaetia bacterium]